MSIYILSCVLICILARWLFSKKNCNCSLPMSNHTHTSVDPEAIFSACTPLEPLSKGAGPRTPIEIKIPKEKPSAYERCLEKEKELKEKHGADEYNDAVLELAVKHKKATIELIEEYFAKKAHAHELRKQVVYYFQLSALKNGDRVPYKGKLVNRYGDELVVLSDEGKYEQHNILDLVEDKFTEKEIDLSSWSLSNWSFGNL